MPALAAAALLPPQPQLSVTTAEEHRILRAAFRELDADASGVLTPNELKAAAHRLGVDLSMSECKQAIAKFSGSGGLNFDQFVEYWNSDDVQYELKHKLTRTVGDAVELKKLRAENKTLHKILEKAPHLATEFYEEEAVEAIKDTTLFHEVPEKVMKKMAKKMRRRVFDAGAELSRQGEVCVDALIVASGTVTRWANVEGREQVVTTFCDRSIGTLNLNAGANAVSRFNARCDTDVVVYSISRSDLDLLMRTEPELSIAMVHSLTQYIKNSQPHFSTPLFEQRAHQTSFTAVTIAAIMESFFRSGMNALINQAIFGGQRGKLFPDMHIQIPTRVVYINGIKQIRYSLDSVDVTGYQSPGMMRAILSFAPGVLMCPMSSILEATNAGDKNPEPIVRRATRGYTPRLAREIIFGVGLNQLADYCAERTEGVFPQYKMMSRSLGSLSAGLVAGYLSHVPHILSTMKLARPHLSYGDLWQDFYKPSLANAPEWMADGPAKHRLAKFMAVAFPVGCFRRSCQIAGTFAIINGVTYGLRDQSWY